MKIKMMLVLIIMTMMITNLPKVYAATVDETTDTNTIKYPKSFQMKLFESKNQEEVERAMNESKLLQANTVKVDVYGIAWKSEEKVYKVRVKAGDIDFKWTPIFMGYTWLTDLSMWSNKGLLGKNAIVEFIGKNNSTIWSVEVVFPQEVKIPKTEVEIVPPCPLDTAPTLTPMNGVTIGEAPGQGPVAK